MIADLLGGPGAAILSAAALAAGGLAAQIHGAVSCAWPAKPDELLGRLRAVKEARKTGKARMVLGLVAITSLLIAGAAVAYAAQPSTPARPSTPAVKVAPKSNPSSQEVGPAAKGQAAKPAPKDPPTTLEAAANRIKGIYSAADQTILNNQIAWGRWDDKPFAGLTLDQTRRMVIYNSTAWALQNAVEQADRDELYKVFWAGQRQAAIDSGYINYVRFLDGEEAIGPDSFYVPGDVGWAGAGKDIGLHGTAGYVMADNADATGGFTLKKSPARGYPLFPELRDVAGSPK